LKLANLGAMQMTIWLDTQTNMPLKRLVIAPSEKARLTEVYTEFTLNPKLDGKMFELPK